MTKLNANQENYLAVLGIPPPPPITPDTPPAAQSWIEMATAALAEAANMGDPADYAEAEKGHAERAALATDAATQFPANEEQQAQGMDQTMQMAQQLPQMASSVAGALTGALGGIMQPLMQVPQQLAQTGQQLLQTGMGAFQQNGLGDDSYADEWGADGLGDLGGAGGGGGGDIGAGGGAGAGGGGGIGTTPMSMLGPPATPSGVTAPTAAGRATAPIAPAEAAPSRSPMMGGGMGPMMPPGMAHGGAGGGERDDKTDKKRISVPAVKNGAPVQGRITTPPPVPVVAKSVEDAKAEVVRRRIVVPSDKATGKAADQRDNPPKD